MTANLAAKKGSPSAPSQMAPIGIRLTGDAGLVSTVLRAAGAAPRAESATIVIPNPLLPAEEHEALAAAGATVSTSAPEQPLACPLFLFSDASASALTRRADIIVVVVSSDNDAATQRTGNEMWLALHQPDARAAPLILLDLTAALGPEDLPEGQTLPEGAEPRMEPKVSDAVADLHGGLMDQEAARLYPVCVLDEPAPGRPASALDSLLSQCADAVLAPRHVLWDFSTLRLTDIAQRAARRAFWIFDDDSDGFLTATEAAAWYQAMYGPVATLDEDLEAAREYLRDTEASNGDEGMRGRLVRAEDGALTSLGFFAITHLMLSEGRERQVWAMLRRTGIKATGLPYTDAEITAATAVDSSEFALHLSHRGAGFFGSLYTSRRRFQQPQDLFAFTPPCPWAGLYGLPDAGTRIVGVAEFIQCWRFMALHDPESVARFARYWRYEGPMERLFTVCRLREHRASPDAPTTAGGAPSPPSEVPPSAQLLVLGSPRCGKTSLMRRMAESEAGAVGEMHIMSDDAHPSGRSVTLLTVPPTDQRGGDMLLALQELADEDVHSALESHEFMAAIDSVLLCYDGSDPYSFSYVAALFPLLAQYPKLPLIIVLCKADESIEDQLGLRQTPEIFCRQRGLAWPPAITSISTAGQLNGLPNEVDLLPMLLADVVSCPALSAPVEGGRKSNRGGEVVTTARKIKRVFVLAAAAYAAFRFARWAFGTGAPAPTLSSRAAASGAARPAGQRQRVVRPTQTGPGGAAAVRTHAPVRVAAPAAAPAPGPAPAAPASVASAPAPAAAPAADISPSVAASSGSDAPVAAPIAPVAVSAAPTASSAAVTGE